MSKGLSDQVASNDDSSENARPERPMTPVEREEIIQNTISSMRISGIEISYEQASRAYDKAMSKPLPKLEELPD